MGTDHRARIHLVMDQIRSQLDGDVSLQRMAEAAHLSPYHFHRVFTTVAGETPARFARRARLERAVRLLHAAPSRSLTSIAAEVGFATPSDFARVFRAAYGQTPSSWDRHTPLGGGVDLVGPQPPPAEAEVVVVDRGPARLLTFRVADPWRGENLLEGYQRFTAQLEGAGLAWWGCRLLGLSWESPQATPPERLVYDLAFDVTAHDGGAELADSGHDAIRLLDLPPLRAAELRCRSLAEIAVGWDMLHRRWLPRSGYEPDDLPAIKRFRQTPARLDAAAWDVDCSVAIRPRRP